MSTLGDSIPRPMIRRHVLLAVLGGVTIGSGLGVSAAAGGGYDSPGEVYAALHAQPPTPLTVAGGRLEVVFAEAAGLDRAPVLAWIRRSAVAVSTYFGRFPVKRVGILVVAEDGDRVGHATTFGLEGSAIRIHVGRSAGAAAFERDWVLVHEMVHLALPTVPRESLWLQEGNATYVEPIARAQAGQLDAATVWRWSLEGMPKGLPGPGDRGLDQTPSWGRTYWGGATFWLLADIAIDEASHGRRSLRDALRAINSRSGGNVADWPVDRVMATGDAAVGGDALQRLYAAQKDTPVSTDLPALFARLGVAEVDGRIVFDDSARLADFRRRLTGLAASPIA